MKKKTTNHNFHRSGYSIIELSNGRKKGSVSQVFLQGVHQASDQKSTKNPQNTTFGLV